MIVVESAWEINESSQSWPAMKISLPHQDLDLLTNVVSIGLRS